MELQILISENPLNDFINHEKLLTQLNTEFNSDEQKQFVMNFYLYQRYDKTSDFIIDLDKIWSWLGFSQKNHAKTLLQKHFTLDIHYKILLPAPREQTITENNRGGHNKEIIMLTINTFKSFCLKAKTSKASEIHEYYIKLEDIIMSSLMKSMEAQHQLFQEKNQELIKQLELVNEKNKHTTDLSGDIYIAVNAKEIKKDIWKVGETINYKKRLVTMNTCESDGCFIILRKFNTKNRILSEKLIHTYLDVNKYKYNKEFYNIELDQLIGICELFTTIVDEITSKTIQEFNATVKQYYMNKKLEFYSPEKTKEKEVLLDEPIELIQKPKELLNIDKKLLDEPIELIQKLNESPNIHEELYIKKIIYKNKNTSIFPIFLNDSSKKVETLDEFIKNFCEFDINSKIKKCLLYDSFKAYISKSGFMGLLQFYKKIQLDYTNIKTSITCPEFFNGIKIKPGIIKDIHVYIRNFIDLKCDIRNNYRVTSKDLSTSFLKFIKDDLEISKGQIKKFGLNKVNFNSILKCYYPFKFQFITQHTQGWCGLKLKSQTIYELSDLVQNFYTTKIEISLDNHINKRPIFNYFVKWYNDNYSKNDIQKSWTNSLFGEEFKKYVNFSGYKWQNIKLI
jgi:hypothetical protein